MNIEETKQAIAVMQAYIDKKEIEFSVDNGKTWGIAMTPVWNWVAFIFRIKPQPEYIPFDNSDNLVGKIIIDKLDGINYLIVAQSLTSISLNFSDISYKRLLNHFNFFDGSPCGKVKQ